jgi:hypothetical protein
MEASPFSKLSPELRIKIDGYVVASDDPIHIRDGGAGSWQFRQCSLKAFNNSTYCKCNIKGVCVDPLLSTCKQIRDEAAQVVSNLNQILFEVELPGLFGRLLKSFAHLVQYISSLVLAFDRPYYTPNDTLLEHFRTLCTQAVRV